MAEQDFFEFSAKFDVEVEKSSMSQACSVLDAFYNKYGNRKMKIDTSDMVKTAQAGISKVQKLYKQGIDEVAKGNISWWQIEDGLEEQFNASRAKIKEFFKETSLVFSDGSMLSALDENLSEALSEKFAKGITVVAADLGERVKYLKEQISDTLEEIDISKLSKYYDQSVDFTSGDMSKNQLLDRIDLLKKLIDYQKELEVFNGGKFSDTNAPSLQGTGIMVEQLNTLQKYYAQLEEFNLKTIEQLERRNSLIKEANEDWQWSDGEQNEIKNDINNKDLYDSAIESLERYIRERKEVIKKLRDSEDELFSVDGITDHVDNANNQIARFQGYLKELQDLHSGKTTGGDTPIVGDLSRILPALEKIEEAINNVVAAFKPLTDALANEDSALSAMVRSNVADLELLNSKVEETFKNIEELSKKDFNVTNVTSLSSGDKTQSDLEQIRQFRKEAKEVFKQVEDLYGESMTTSNKIKGTPEGLEAVLNFSNTMSSFDMTDLAKRIKSRSALALGTVIDELNEWKKVLLQFNQLRNNVEAGSFNVSKYTDTSSKIKIGSKTTDKDEKKIVDENAVDGTDILNKIKTLSEQIETELTSIRTKIEETFNFNTIDPNIENITAATDKIYQQFVELQTKIKALDLNIPVVEPTKTGDGSINDAADAMKNEGDAAKDAVPKKDAFTEANKRAAESANETKASAEAAAEGMRTEAKAAEEVRRAYDKVATTVDGDGSPLYATKTKSRVGDGSVNTTTERYTYEKDEDGNGSWKLSTETLVKDYKAYAKLQTDAQKKIQKAQATLQNFMSQFDNKTAGKWSNTGLYRELKGTLSNGIGSVDEIDGILNKMQLLDAEYNNVVKSFRKGTKSMNPFVNAFNSMDEMEEKVKQVQLDFANLKFPTDTLRENVDGLPELLDKLTKSLKPDKNGIVDIARVAEAYGNLNAAIKAANASIKTQRKADSSQLVQLKQLDDLYEKQAKSAAKITKYREQLKSDSVTDPEKARLKEKIKEEQANIKNIQAQIDQYGELYNKEAQLLAIERERAKALSQIADNRAKTEGRKQKDDEKNAAKLQKEQEAATVKAQKEQEAIYENALKAQEKLYNLKKQMVGVDPESSKGQEQLRELTKAQNEYNKALSKTNWLRLNAGQQQEIENLDAQYQKELRTKQKEYQSGISAEQEAKDLKYILSLYKQYTDAAASIKKLQVDPTGADHSSRLAAAVEDVKSAKEALLSLGIDVNNISASELLTEQQKISLLAEQVKYKRQIRDIENGAQDRTATKQNRQNQNYGKTIFNRESRYFDSISANVRSLEDAELSTDFLDKIDKYISAYKELEQLRSIFENSSNAAKDSGLRNQFQDSALNVERLRKELTGLLKDYQKFSDIPEDSVFARGVVDTNKFSDAKTAMLEFANAATDGKFQLEGFNSAGTEMWGTLDKGNGVLERVKVSFSNVTNEMVAFKDGSKQVASSWGKLSSSLTSGVSRLVTMYLSLYDIIRYVRQGFNYVKEIDLAMTELKKVTDATDATYNKFLKTASQVSSVIGSTVSDFTDATAAFARLGYSIEESTSMAETAIVYKNVADGLDSVEAATDSIISTMMAYGIQASDTMSIVDKFNAVGKIYADYKVA